MPRVWRPGGNRQVDHCDLDLQELVATGKAQGYLTYDQVNEYLPDEAVTPEKLDNLLIALEELGIELVTDGHRARISPAEESERSPTAAGPACPNWHRARPLDRGRPVRRRGRRQCRLQVAGARAAQAERRSGSHVSVADVRDSAADARTGNRASQEDRGHAKAVSPHGAGMPFCAAGHGPHAGRGPSRRAPLRSHDQGLADRAADQGADSGPHAAQSANARAFDAAESDRLPSA